MLEEEPEEGGERLINDLPDELLENIFSRLSPYNDLDSVKCVCKRWTAIARKVIRDKKENFEAFIRQGRVDTVKYAPVINSIGQVPSRWITERFGHMACYYDKCIYVFGGTTHTPTTFNDMWGYNLSNGSWSRVICTGQSDYPTPKALATAVQYRDNLVVFGGWSHPSPYPLMQPWKIFDELHIFNFNSNRWTCITNSNSPLPTAGHSASIVGDQMIIFGGRTFNQAEQSFPLSDDVWAFSFESQEWTKVEIEAEGPNKTQTKPLARYGQTQVTLDENHVLVIGGCGGPNQIFSDVWLLSSTPGRNFALSKWEKVQITNAEKFTANDFHYSGCKIGNSVVFLERSTPISPFCAFLQYDGQPDPVRFPGGEALNMESSRQRYFHSRCTSGLRGGVQNVLTMSIYALDLSQILVSKKAQWVKEDPEVSLGLRRPSERLLYSLVPGRAELILFGGFYKDPNSPRHRVTSDVFVIKQLHKSY